MTRYFSKKLLLARAAGTGDFVATDAVRVTEVEINPLAGDTVTREIERGFFGAQKQFLVNRHQKLSFSVELAAAATAGAAQPWERLIAACGFQEDLENKTAHPETTMYKLNSYRLDSYLPDRVKLGFILDGSLHTVDNARGNVAIELAANAIPLLKFEFIGDAATVADAPDLTGDFRAFQEPLIVSNDNTPTVEIFGESNLPLSSYSINLGNSIVYESPINGSSGTKRTGRNVTGQLVIDAPSRETWDPFAEAAAGDEETIRIVHGHGRDGGCQIEISSPKCQLNDVWYSDRNGIVQHNLSFTALPDGTSGNDELKIYVT